jgi:probable HAF family extracellular repeat protein
MSVEIVGHPFVWTERNGMQDLNTLIPSTSGWVLNTAAGINAWGQIVGSGVHNGETHGFLLTPRL